MLDTPAAVMLLVPVVPLITIAFPAAEPAAALSLFPALKATAAKNP